MSEINDFYNISVKIFFDFWYSSSNAKSMIQFCKKHFTQLIKLIIIFCLIKILISCFNVTWSKTFLMSSNKHVSVFSWLFVICTSCTRFSTAFIAHLCFLFLIWLKSSSFSFIFAVYDNCIAISFFAILSKQFSSVIILYVFEIKLFNLFNFFRMISVPSCHIFKW